MSNANENDESVSQFLSITGSVDVNQALSYLEMAGNDLETAISLYLEHSGTSGGITNTNSINTNTGTNTSDNTHVSYNPDGTEQVRAPDQTRRMRLMDYDVDDHQPSSVGIPMGMFMDQPFPFQDPFRSMGMGMGSLSSAAAGASGMNAFQTNHDHNDNDHEDNHEEAKYDSFMDRPYNPHHQDDIRTLMNQFAAQEQNGQQQQAYNTTLGNATMTTDTTTTTTNTSAAAASSSANARSLANLFQPPIHLIHTAGGFQGAKAVAKDTRRWLLVNLQSDEEFACHALNRDVWRDELVENLIREGFIFWQTDNASPEGQTYEQRYKVQAYPHIGIIDPRTGRLMFRKEGWTQVNPLRPEQFAEIAVDFCSRHSFDKAPVGVPMSSHVASGSIGGSSSSSRNNHAAAMSNTNMYQNPDSMTEEEQLQAALQASMGDTMIQGQNQHAYDSDDSDVYILDHNDDDESVDDHLHDTNVSMDSSSLKMPAEQTGTKSSLPSSPSSSKMEEKPSSFWDDISSMNVQDEPSTTTNVARIMIRLPDGKRLVRKFDNNGTVKDIYAFVAQSYPDFKTMNKEFEMMSGFPPKDLMTCVDDSIASAGLAGESITVRWKD